MTLEGNRGFTFLEMLTALALLAVLIIIAWGKFNKSYEESLKEILISDLRNLATAQEVYYRANLTYTSDRDLLTIEPSAKSEIEVASADSTGWSAWNTMEGTDVRCEVYVGNGHSAALGIAASPEQISCGNP